MSMIAGLHQKLKEEREKKGFSQKQISSIIGISASMISSYESGQRTPSILVLAKYAQALSVSTDYLIGIKTEIEEHNLLDLSDLSKKEKEAVRALVDALK